MKIQWLGHSCFLITNGQGKRLLTDPFDATIGYPVPTAQAEVVTVSHDHFDHNSVDLLSGGYHLVREDRRYSGFGFDLYAVDSFHDDQGGALRGTNRMFVIEADGLRIAHLGDLGTLPSAKQLTQLGRIDVLLIPVGGYYTLDAAEARRTMQAIGPRVTIPMHYRNRWWSDSKIEPVTHFTGPAGDCAIDSDTIEITKGNIDSLPKVVVLTYPTKRR